MITVPPDVDAESYRPAPVRREIFMAGGRYEMCVVHFTVGDYMLCTTPDGRDIVARPGYGTWCEARPYDLVYLLDAKDRAIAALSKDPQP